MAKYRKKPIVVEAVQFKMPAVRPVRSGPDEKYAGVWWTDMHPYVTTIHGKTHIVDGDWLLPEGDGLHFYPCKPDIFAATYEEVT